MAKIIVEEVQGGSGGDALTLPTADGTAGQFIKTDGSGALSFGAVDSAPLPDDNSLAIGAIFSTSNRQNVYSTGNWSTSGPWTTYYHELEATNDMPQAWNMALGDGMPQASANADNSYKTFSGNHYQASRVKVFAHNRRLGHSMRYYRLYENGTSYPGCTWAIMPIRNSGSSSVDCSFKTTCSTRSNYAGTGKAVYTPTGGTGNYAGTTGGGWTVLHSYDSDNDAYDHTATVTVPAGRTVLFMVTSSWNYRTTYQFFDSLLFRELHTAFTHADIQCDLRMLEALHSCRSPAADVSVMSPNEMYTSCAALYGDR